MGEKYSLASVHGPALAAKSTGARTKKQIIRVSLFYELNDGTASPTMTLTPVSGRINP